MVLIAHFENFLTIDTEKGEKFRCPYFLTSGQLIDPVLQFFGPLIQQALLDEACCLQAIPLVEAIKPLSQLVGTLCPRKRHADRLWTNRFFIHLVSFVKLQRQITDLLLLFFLQTEQWLLILELAIRSPVMVTSLPLLEAKQVAKEGAALLSSGGFNRLGGLHFLLQLLVKQFSPHF